MKLIKYLLFSLIFIHLISCSSSKNFSKTQKQFIGNTSLKPMRLFLITNKQDSVLLRKKSAYIRPNPKNKTLQLFAKRLITTVKDSASLGVGIAAPQVGILKNIIAVQRLDKDNEPFEIYLNPVIKYYSTQKRSCLEGCLSIPNRRAITLDRSFEIKIEYDKLDGTHHTEKITDFVSVIFQHEIDHLNGILFIDHLLKESN
ncbi:MAG: peptide deformylase [Flavobacteriaceae bacterium]|nr:peptide deformylase [Flavobacteriaceae bacterium]